MRRTPAFVVLVGALAWACSPNPARAGVWVTLAAGLPGASAPASEGEFWFNTPHAPPLVAVNQLTGGATVEATTGGGSVFFGGAGTPVLLNVGDGSAYIASGSPPDGVKGRAPSGGGSAAPATTAPVAGGDIPTAAALLGIALADPLADGSRGLTATVTDAGGTVLGTGTLTVPDGGWWVLGLTPGEQLPTPPPPPAPVEPTPTPAPVEPTPTPPPVEPTPIPTPIPVDPFPTIPPPVEPMPPAPVPTTPGGGPVATPEPSSMVLVGLGGVCVGAWRRSGRGRGRAA